MGHVYVLEKDAIQMLFYSVSLLGPLLLNYWVKAHKLNSFVLLQVLIKYFCIYDLKYKY
jgi:hypothetical protein